jgi:NADPH:quinone reductase-like Zn-dependent oxidoreductase
LIVAEVYPMKAALLLPGASKSILEIYDVAVPEPAKGELLIKVVAAGVVPSELQWYPTTHTKEGKPRLRVIPGHEFSGVVSALGPNTKGFSVGDEVFGMSDWFADGATAEYCIAPPASIVRKPAKLSHATAASIPISALTAWQGLFTRANLQCNESILIHGASGAVGAYVVQLAKLHGADVTATASTRSLDFVASLGADAVVDYRTHPFETGLRPFDVIFDTVGGATLRRSWPLLKPDGRMVTIAADSEGTTDGRVKQAFFIVEPNQEQLADIAVLIGGGSLRPFVAAELPLAQAPAAYAGTASRTNPHGKIVIVL